jgi:DNA-binding transcriptional LysR family regulator
VVQDLNDLYYFVKVVDHAGFAPAGRALNIPKSKLSRRIAGLEQQFGVRLLQRTTRHFSVTETGRDFYTHCVAMLVQADAARQAVERRRSEPQGLIRMSCPTALLAFRVGDLVSRFMVEYPKVQIHLEATNRQVDVLAEGIDIAIRVRFPPLEDSDLAMRVLADSPQRLVASPSLLKDQPLLSDPAELAGFPSLDWARAREQVWQLAGPDGATATVKHHPRYLTDDMTALRQAALNGVGIVQLPFMVVEEDLRRGDLLDIIPGWAPKGGIVHAVFPSPRGLLPAVRTLLDYLAAHVQSG